MINCLAISQNKLTILLVSHLNVIWYFNIYFWKLYFVWNENNDNNGNVFSFFGGRLAALWNMWNNDRIVFWFTKWMIIVIWDFFFWNRIFNVRIVFLMWYRMIICFFLFERVRACANLLLFSCVLLPIFVAWRVFCSLFRLSCLPGVSLFCFFVRLCLVSCLACSLALLSCVLSIAYFGASYVFRWLCRLYLVFKWI